jgi:hypothetical protein
MAAAYSMDLRSRVLTDADAGMSSKNLAARYHVSRAWVATDLIRRYGRSRRGDRVHDHTPHHHWQTSTFVAALRVEGLTAPGLLDGPMDGDTFLA